MSSSTYSTEDKKSRFTGVAVTVLLHLLVLVFCFRLVFMNSIMALPMSVIEVSFEPEPEPVKIKPREQSSARPILTGKKVEDAPSEPTKAAEIDDQSGEVEVPVEEPIPVKIDERSLFRSQDKGDVEATASGSNPDSRNLFAGSSEPNAGIGDGGSGFDVSGRSIIGRLEQPTNTSNRDGRVVVEITVDQKGQVTKAQARAQGTTIQDATLWKAAEEAARKTKFNPDVNASPLQTGTITYVFRLK
jgi:TonB family protein